jgi:hypothetical protein
MEQDIHLSRNGLGQYRVPWVDQSLYSPHGKSLIVYYYIDRCDLWGFIREINSGISRVRYHFFPPNYFYTSISVVVTSFVVLR